MTIPTFTSPLKDGLGRFLQFKRAAGCRYREEARALGGLDRFLGCYLAGKDPVEYRRRLLAKSPRVLAALELAAEKAGWGKPLPAGHARGIGLSTNIGSFTAQVAEVSVTQGKIRVHRVVCAVDCGQAVNPAGIEQQIQSGIAFGLEDVAPENRQARASRLNLMARASSVIRSEPGGILYSNSIVACIGH